MSQNQEETASEYHRPVLVTEVIDLLRPVMPGMVVDATFGGGGHSREMLEVFGDDVQVVGIDRDPDAVANAAALGIDVVQANFADVAGVISDRGLHPAAIFFDFGVSSHQFDEAERGFAYRKEGPLDMRMGPDAAFSAADLVNSWPVEDIARVIRQFGEEPMARRIAKAIVAARPIDSTSQLATVIADAIPAARRRAGHPARRTFQAIRIAVNDELAAVAGGLDGAIESLEPGGRVIAISYHSLEDRIVKRRFAEGAEGCVCPPDLPVCGCDAEVSLKVLTRKPIRASGSEVEENNRARSAVLRAAEKVAA
jgi:16S rRNA (cytosine1402-N4)-methyltransferase